MKAIAEHLWPLLLLLCRALLAAEPSPDELVKIADEFRGPQGTFSCDVKVEDKNGDTSTGETTYKVYVKDIDYSLVETMQPERLKGRKLLMRRNNLWLYLPTVKRPTRVSLQQKLTGEVANGDIARTNFSSDYSAKLEGIEKIGDKDCYKLALTARQKDVTYRSITYWVEKGTHRPVKAEFYALSGKLLKTGEYSHFVPYLGHPRMTEMLIRDALQSSRQSHLTYSNYKQESLSDSFFSKESLSE